MSRREFIVLLSEAAALLPLSARSQEANGPPTIGFLAPDRPSWSSWIAAFENRLRALGWIDGRSVAIEYRWSQGRPERVAEIAAEFVKLKVDVIVTSGSAVAILKKATTSIPIVSAVAADAVSSGIVTSLTHPGGNVTGYSIQLSEVAGKRLELLQDVLPNLRRFAVLFDTDYQATVLEKDAIQVAARKLGLEGTPYGIRRREDIAPSCRVDFVVEAEVRQAAFPGSSFRSPRKGPLSSYSSLITRLYRRGRNLTTTSTVEAGSSQGRAQRGDRA